MYIYSQCILDLVPIVVGGRPKSPQHVMNLSAQLQLTTWLPCLSALETQPLQLRMTFIVQVAAIPFRWKTFLRSPQTARQPFYSAFLSEAQQDPPAYTTQLPQLLPDARPAAAVGLSGAAVAAAVAEAVRSALGNGVSNNTPLLQAGLDSLGMPDAGACQGTLPMHSLSY